MNSTWCRTRWCTLGLMSIVGVFALAACGGGGSDSTTSGGSGSSSSSEETAASSEEPAAQTYKVGVVLPGLNVPYWASMGKGTEEAAESMPGVEVDVQGGSSQTGVDETTAMVNTINDMLTKGTEALIVADGLPQLTPTLERALSQGVPVVFTDANVGPLTADQVTTVATEPVAAGKQAGEFIVEHLHGKGEVGMLSGIPGLKASLDRTEAAKSVLEEGGVKVVAELPTECDRAKAISATKDMLTAHPDISLIYTGCGPPALGAIQAVKQLGRAGDVEVVGFDGYPEEFEAVEAGTLLASVAQFPRKQGELAVAKAVEALETESVPPGADSGTVVVTKENVGSVENY